MSYVSQGFDFGISLRHRLVDESYQYETLVRWGNYAPYGYGLEEWVPTITLSFHD